MYMFYVYDDDLAKVIFNFKFKKPPCTAVRAITWVVHYDVIIACRGPVLS